MHFNSVQEYLQYITNGTTPVEPKRYEAPKEEPETKADTEEEKPRRRGRKA